MKKYIQIVLEDKSAKLCWVDVRRNGVYIGPSEKFKGIHFSYHIDGKRHFADANGNHLSHDKGKLCEIEKIDSFKNVGGFSASISDLNWLDYTKKEGKGIFVQLSEKIRRDFPFLFGLFLCRSSYYRKLVKEIKSRGETCEDVCKSFPLGKYKNLLGVIQIQYNTIPKKSFHHTE
jgi:hypothetical protein